MIRHYLRRAVDNGRADFQHRRVGKGFQDDFVADSVDVALRNGDSYSLVFHFYLK